MGIAVSYPHGQATKELASSMSIVNKRYQQLKQQMLQSSEIDNIRKRQIQQIRAFLTTINANAQYLDDQTILNYLGSGTSKGLSETLQTMALNSSGFSEDPKSALKIPKLQTFFNALEKLYGLLERGKGKKEISYDYHSLERELNKIAIGLADSPQLTMKETGNILGRIAAQGTIPYMLQQSIENLKQNLAIQGGTTGARIRIVDTGAQKIPGTKKTITTDTMLVSVDPLTGKILATLQISDKFNAKYKANAHSTNRPIKLASRTIRNFINEVKISSIAQAYETALINFISYHKINLKKDYHRTDFTKIVANNWRNLRQAIGAEMMYNEIYQGKGQFNYNGTQINDLIDLSIYGDRIYLASDVLNTINTRKRNSGNFNMAQISIPKARSKFMTNPTVDSALPKKIILDVSRTQGMDAAEEKVSDIIETTVITYSQTIVFS